MYTNWLLLLKYLSLSQALFAQTNSVGISYLKK
jgi:hypothetical protein